LGIEAGFEPIPAESIQPGHMATFGGDRPLFGHSTNAEDCPRAIIELGRASDGIRGSCRSLARLGCQRCAKKELAEQTIPVMRVVLPTRSSEDIAGPAAFLASDLSVYVTGHIIMADGRCRTV